MVSSELNHSIKINKRAREAAATALVSILSSAESTNNTIINFEEFLNLPTLQPGVLQMMSLHLPFKSQRSARKSARRAESVAVEKSLKRVKSIDEVQQMKTSPRGDQ